MTSSPERRPGLPVTGGRRLGGPRARLPLSRSALFSLLGVLGYLAIRTLPPDNSLALVRQAGTLNVCFPPSFVPYIRAVDDGADGNEAQLVKSVARELGLKVGWNLQAGWGQAPDPVDWGLRPEACDVVTGGIIRRAGGVAIASVFLRRTGIPACLSPADEADPVTEKAPPRGGVQTGRKACPTNAMT